MPLIKFLDTGAWRNGARAACNYAAVSLTRSSLSASRYHRRRARRRKEVSNDVVIFLCSSVATRLLVYHARKSDRRLFSGTLSFSNQWTLCESDTNICSRRIYARRCNTRSLLLAWLLASLPKDAITNVDNIPLTTYISFVYRSLDLDSFFRTIYVLPAREDWTEIYAKNNV